jgi:hypothetical protein
MIKKQLTEVEKEILNRICFLCGDDDKFTVYINEIDKAVCIECVGTAEFVHFVTMKRSKQGEKS